LHWPDSGLCTQLCSLEVLFSESTCFFAI
jgi:hypothetical protein